MLKHNGWKKQLKDLIVGWVLSLLMTTSLTKMCDQPSKVLCFLASIEFNQISNFIIPIINEHGTNTSTPNLNIDDVPSFFCQCYIYYV